MSNHAEIYALCAVVAMQKYYWLDAIDYKGIGHAYRVMGWHDTMELFAMECLNEHRRNLLHGEAQQTE